MRYLNTAILHWICTLHNAQQNISNKLCNFGVSFFCVFKLGLEHLVEIKAKCSNFYDTRADLAFIRDYYHDDDTWSCYQGGNLEGWHTNEVKTQLMCVFWVDKVCTWWQKVAKHKRGQINMDPVPTFTRWPVTIVTRVLWPAPVSPLLTPPQLYLFILRTLLSIALKQSWCSTVPSSADWGTALTHYHHY